MVPESIIHVVFNGHGHVIRVIFFNDVSWKSDLLLFGNVEGIENWFRSILEDVIKIFLDVVTFSDTSLSSM